ncbi:MAG: VWA domain-containing protein [Planctomycetes bacterium]|nr:VWA domain-containing protein [Planctomycetota bacterium]
MNVWSLQPPTWWPALLALPPLLLLLTWLRRRHARALAAELGPREAALLGRRTWGRTRATLAVAAVAAIGLALLRPVSPGREAQLAPDVVLCVDVSRSMHADDVAPSRFALLREQVRALLDGAVGSRFALVAFAGDAHVVAPLTADRDAVAWLLDELAPGAVGRGGTDLGAAVDAAVAAFERVQTSGEVLLLTDGEDFGEVGARAAAAAAARGHRVHCVGYGSTAGSKIVVERDGEQAFLVDAAGNDVVTRLDVASLTALAEAGDGALWRDDARDALLRRWRDELVPFAARRRLAAGEADVVQRFAWPLLVGLLLWMLRLCLPERRR